jgi:uncharacterized membrane protein
MTHAERRPQIAAFAAIGFAVLVLAVWAIVYSTPRYPLASELPLAVEVGYQPGGAGCTPVAIAQMRANAQGQVQRDRCAAIAEDYRLAQLNAAQQAHSADMAEGGVKVAFGQAKIGFAQTVATILAFGSALGAAYYAREAAREGRRSADAAQTLLTDFERPWVVMIGNSFDRGTGATEGPNGWQLKLWMKNIGRSPAALEWYEIAVAERSKLPATPDYSNTERQYFPDTLAASEEWAGGNFTHSLLAAGVGSDESTNYVIYGRLIYRKLSGGRHETRFIYDVDPVAGEINGTEDSAYNTIT